MLRILYSHDATRSMLHFSKSIFRRLPTNRGRGTASLTLVVVKRHRANDGPRKETAFGFGMILETIAVPWRDSKHIPGAKQKSQGGFRAQVAIFIFIWIRVRNFQRAGLSSHDRECLRAASNRFGILDPLWRQSQVPHDVTGISFFRSIRHIKGLRSFPNHLSLGLGSILDKRKLSSFHSTLISHNLCSRQE
jgi:hypothetical protein